ncbi:MAG: flavin reductase family protein [Pseudomonadota bacterium]
MKARGTNALRTALGSYMTGVTVVTTKGHDGRPVGFTANSFTSVSLDPPLLLVCPGKFLSSYEHFAGCNRFAISILAEGQEEVASTFASYKGDRFACTPHHEDSLGNPLIDGALAHFSCSTHQVIEAGDHAILIGKVRAFCHVSGQGLGYANGQFFSLGLERAVFEHAGRSVLCGAIAQQDGDVWLEATTAGYHLPHIVSDDRSSLRRNLARYVEASGLRVDLGQAYSVFDEAQTHCSYYLARVRSFEGDRFERHPIGELSRLRFASQPITDMMHRFASEAQTQSFGLYIGDARDGDVHSLSERN